jgi:hypothetical protein
MSPPSAYPPGYPPPAGLEPTYQAAAPWPAPEAPSPATAPYAAAPASPLPGSAVFGSAGLPNGSGAYPPVSRTPRRTVMTVIVVIVVVALVGAGIGVALGGGSSSNPSPTSSTPNPAATGAARQLLRSALAAAGGINAFHYVATSTVSGGSGYSQRTVGDAGPTSGKQVITIGAQRFTVIVVGTACYLKGNASALVANLGLSSAQAAAHAGQWISLAKTDAPYASVYAAVTAPSAIADNVTITATTVLAPSTVDGRRVQTVTGTIAPTRIAGQTIAPKGTASLAVRASSPHLPVRYVEEGTQDHQKSSSTVTFSRWGEAVAVTAPANAVAYSSLGVGSGSIPTTPGGTVVT